MSTVKMYYSQLNDGGNDPSEFYIHTTEIDDFIGAMIDENYFDRNRVYLLSASKVWSEQEGGGEEIEVIVTADTEMLCRYAKALTDEREWTRFHLQEYPTFAAAYEVAGYILEGDKLAS
jgi:hypothetical protein